MSQAVSRLTDQLRRAFEGAAWHGPSVLETLHGVTAEQARARPIARAHTIEEVVLHLSGTYRLVLRRLLGDTTQLSEEEDWPAAPPAEWPAPVVALQQLHDELMRAVALFPEENLDRPLIADPPYTAWTQFIGITQHDLYHAGQIVLLKKALASR